MNLVTTQDLWNKIFRLQHRNKELEAFYEYVQESAPSVWKAFISRDWAQTPQKAEEHHETAEIPTDPVVDRHSSVS